MTKPKHVATTLSNIMANPVMMAILNRQQNIQEVLSVVDSYWKYDLETRKPSPAEYDDQGNLLKATNLDLATFLYALSERGAVINLPKYKSKRRKTVKEGEMLLSKDNRHGKITGVGSNANTFGFNLKIIDQNVVGQDQTGKGEDYSGAPRAFLMTDFDGSWYEGWESIQFMPSADENKFLTENKLWGGATVTFDNFVNKEKWISFFGQYYFLTKAMVGRLTEERKFLQAQKKKMEAAGIELPPSGQKEFQQNDTWNKKTASADKGHPVKVNCLEVEIDVPEHDSEFADYPMDSESLLLVRQNIKAINKALTKFRFVTRCIEYSIHSQDRFDTFPVWLKNVKWEDDYKQKGKRKKWRRLKLTQPGVGQISVGLRYRNYEKTEYVNEAAAKEAAVTA